jgi:septal ring factor EnvC (AmiA/AmiB activator)
MKKFFTELLEILSAVALSSFIVYSVFTKIIGTPQDIKSIESNVVTTKNKVDTLYQKQDLTNKEINQIENTQIDISQRLFDNNYLLKENNQEIKANNQEIKELHKLIKNIQK